MTIKLKIATENESEEWDKLVESSPHGTVFHTWKWAYFSEKKSFATLKLVKIAYFKLLNLCVPKYS